MRTRHSTSIEIIASQEPGDDDRNATNYSGMTEEYSIPEDPDADASDATVDYSTGNKGQGYNLNIVWSNFWLCNYTVIFTVFNVNVMQYGHTKYL